MKYLRRTLRDRRVERVRSLEIRRQLGTTPLLEMIGEHKLKWFGHLYRVNNDQVKRVSGKNIRGPTTRILEQKRNKTIADKGKDVK